MGKKVGYEKGTVNNTALHIAMRQGNKMSADVILRYMSKIGYNSSRNFKDLFNQLVEY